MARKLTRTRIAAAVLAGTALAGGVPAPAQAGPRIAYGQEDVFTYYSNAQHSTIVGQHFLGSCVPASASWGTFSKYSTLYEYSCAP
jgi:hypothetical protein